MVSAKISIETDDPELAALLGLLIGNALQVERFTNMQAKIVMLARTVRKPEQFHQVSEVCRHSGDAEIQPEDIRMPPQLKPMRWLVPPPNVDFVGDIVARNPSIKDQPIVLSIHPDTCPVYEEAEKRFLTTGISDEQ